MKALTRTFALTLIAVLISSATAEDHAPKDTITLMSYNVENYFDEHEDPYTRDETGDEKTDREMEQIANLLRAGDADFVGIQEIETERLLYDLGRYKVKDLGYDHVYVGHRDYARGINNGGMTRFALPAMTTHRYTPLTLPGEDRTWKFARDVIEFHTAPAPGVELDIFVVHFKSKGNSDGDPKSAKWRLSEATELRRILDQRYAQDPNALYVLMGDLNDTPESDPIQTLLRPGHHGPVLIDVHAHLPKDKRITYLREPYRNTIDYILVSPALAKLYVQGSARVITPPAGESASDHAPVLASFRMPTPYAHQHHPSHGHHDDHDAHDAHHVPTTARPVPAQPDGNPANHHGPHDHGH